MVQSAKDLFASVRQVLLVGGVKDDVMSATRIRVKIEENAI